MEILLDTVKFSLYRVILFSNQTPTFLQFQTLQIRMLLVMLVPLDLRQAKHFGTPEPIIQET